MLDYIPEGWNLPEDNCHDGTYGSGIAGIYHMFRQSDGFVLDMDVCFWTLVPNATLE